MYIFTSVKSTGHMGHVCCDCTADCEVQCLLAYTYDLSIAYAILQAFLKQRRLEMDASETSAWAPALPDSLQQVTVSSIAAMLKVLQVNKPARAPGRVQWG